MKGKASIGPEGQARERYRRGRSALRLMVMDPAAGMIASMRWMTDRPLTHVQIGTLVDREESTVSDALKRARLRLALFERFPLPDPATSYVLARRAELSPEAAGFAYWYAVTLSSERASELTGHGLSEQSRTQDRVLEGVHEAGKSDPRLAKWSTSLNKLSRLPRKFPTKGGAPASIALGKRGNRGFRSRMTVANFAGAPIPWLDPSPTTNEEALARLDFIEHQAVTLDKKKLLWKTLSDGARSDFARMRAELEADRVSKPRPVPPAEAKANHEAFWESLINRFRKSYHLQGKHPREYLAEVLEV
jgi:hypothetical protein